MNLFNSFLCFGYPLCWIVVFEAGVVFGAILWNIGAGVGVFAGAQAGAGVGAMAAVLCGVRSSAKTFVRRASVL